MAQALLGVISCGAQARVLCCGQVHHLLRSHIGRLSEKAGLSASAEPLMPSLQTHID